MPRDHVKGSVLLMTSKKLSANPEPSLVMLSVLVKATVLVNDYRRGHQYSGFSNNRMIVYILCHGDWSRSKLATGLSKSRVFARPLAPRGPSSGS